MDNAKVLKSGEIIGYFAVSGLIGLWHRNSIAVILE